MNSTMFSNAWEPNSGLSAVQTALAGTQEMMARQAEISLVVTAKSLDVFEKLTLNWLRYRRLGLQSAMDTVRRLTAAETIGETAEIASTWTTESLRQFNEECAEIPEQLGTFSADVIASLIEVGETIGQAGSDTLAAVRPESAGKAA
ncbi:MAG: hypothetical protein GC191_17905 [Azospirillum sp.]|nr:hypothetical protein [Azospirillum sp.]